MFARQGTGRRFCNRAVSCDSVSAGFIAATGSETCLFCAGRVRGHHILRWNRPTHSPNGWSTRVELISETPSTYRGVVGRPILHAISARRDSGGGHAVNHCRRRFYVLLHPTYLPNSGYHMPNTRVNIFLKIDPTTVHEFHRTRAGGPPPDSWSSRTKSACE